MRLKGGKVLIDLSYASVENKPNIDVTDEEIKAILEK